MSSFWKFIHNYFDDFQLSFVRSFVRSSFFCFFFRSFFVWSVRCFLAYSTMSCTHHSPPPPPHTAGRALFIWTRIFFLLPEWKMGKKMLQFTQTHTLTHSVYECKYWIDAWEQKRTHTHSTIDIKKDNKETERCSPSSNATIKSFRLHPPTRINKFSCENSHWEKTNERTPNHRPFDRESSCSNSTKRKSAKNRTVFWIRMCATDEWENERAHNEAKASKWTSKQHLPCSVWYMTAE